MDSKEKYKLKRIHKAGIAVGLALTIATGGMIRLIHKFENPSSYTAPKYSTSYVQPENNTEIQQGSGYIDIEKSNEFSVYDEDSNTININLSNYSYLNFIDNLEKNNYDFDMAKYYGLEETMELYNNTNVNKSSSSNLLDSNGKLDANKLIAQVQENNKACMSEGKNSINAFYQDLSNSDISKICNLIAEVTNSKFKDYDINKVANTLTKLTIFKRTGTAANAYVTNNLTFVYNPTMTENYANVQKIKDETKDPDEVIKEVIVHEIGHLLQYSSNDLNDENGIESGFCRMYNIPNEDKTVNIDSLWYSWLLDASAELSMSDYLNTSPGTYAKKISYARSYNLSRIFELDSEKEALENVVFSPDLETTFSKLKLDTKEEQNEFLKYMYSVEILQSDPDEFWDYYEESTKTTPTDDEKTNIRMDIRTDAVKYLSKNFYSNLMKAVYEKKITDINTVFYFMRIWELDSFNHLEYTKEDSIDNAEEFIRWQDSVHDQIFETLAESTSLSADVVENMYDEYNILTTTNEQTKDNCNLNNFNEYTKNYILSAKDNYSVTYYSRNKDMIEYLDKKTTNKTSQTK